MAEQRRRPGWRRTAPCSRSRVRAQRSYRASFALDVVSAVLSALVELAEVGWSSTRWTGSAASTSPRCCWSSAIADVGFSLADMVVRATATRCPTYLRAGTLDVFYLRPQPLLLQLVTSDISLRRLGAGRGRRHRAGRGLAVNDVPLTSRTVGLLALALRQRARDVRRDVRLGRRRAVLPRRRRRGDQRLRLRRPVRRHPAGVGLGPARSRWCSASSSRWRSPRTCPW